MASKYYYQATADGQHTFTKRSVEQGRRKGTGTGKKPRPYSANDIEQEMIE